MPDQLHTSRRVRQRGFVIEVFRKEITNPFLFHYPHVLLDDEEIACIGYCELDDTTGRRVLRRLWCTREELWDLRDAINLILRD